VEQGDRLEQLRRRGLLAPPGDLDSAAVGLERASVDYREKYAGTLLGGACGDALGRPAEGRRPSSIRERHGVIRDFIPWRGWKRGPTGTITDDTQLTMCIAESIVALGRFDPDERLNPRGYLPERSSRGSRRETMPSLGKGFFLRGAMCASFCRWALDGTQNVLEG
jgi:hypothetical protein